MPARAEVLGDGPIGGEEPLRVSWGLEALHAALPLLGRLVGVLRTVVQIAVLAVLDARQDLPLGSTVALQLIGDDDPWDVVAAFEQLAKELPRSLLVPPTLYQDIKDVPFLIHRPPEIVAFPTDREKDLVQVPLIAEPGAAAP